MADMDIVPVDAGAVQGVDGAGQQAVDDEAVESSDDDGDLRVFGRDVAVDSLDM